MELLSRLRLRSEPNVTVYDGLYLALAEASGHRWFRATAALGNVPGCRATVEILPTGREIGLSIRFLSHVPWATLTTRMCDRRRG